MKRSWIHPSVCLLAVLACAEPSDRSDDVVVGLIAPFARNPTVVDGAMLAVEEINVAGGIAVDGRLRRIKLIAEDNAGKPETSVSKALELINRDQAVALIGLPRSYNAIPVGKIAESYEVPLISTMSTNPETTAGKKYVFRLAYLDSFQGRALAEFAFDDLEVRRAAVLIDAVGPYNTYLAEVFSQVFRERGGQLVAFETFTEDDLEITGQLQRINDSGAELLLLPNTTQFVNLHVHAARTSGFAGTFLGGDTWSQGIDPADPAFRGAYFSDLWAPDSAEGNAAAFIERFRRTFGSAPTATAALSYDAISMVAQAIANGGTDPDSIRNELAGMQSYRGASGTISFNGSGDPTRSIFIRRFDEDGKIHLHREISP